MSVDVDVLIALWMHPTAMLLSGHCFNRVRVTTAGCLLWGVCTAGFSFCTSLRLGYFFWAMNGLGFSLVVPIGHSLTADYHDMGDRGKAFGVFYFTGAIGSTVGSLYATNLGESAAGRHCQAECCSCRVFSACCLIVLTCADDISTAASSSLSDKDELAAICTCAKPCVTVLCLLLSS